MRNMKYFLLAIASLFSFETFSQGSLEGDRLALVALYNASSKEEDLHGIEGWVVPGAPGDSPCGWNHVTCEGGRITRLDLGGLQLDCAIPPEIGNLTALKYLDLTGPGSEGYPMGGEIPIELGTLTNLESLYLSGNVFKKNISVIGNLVNLKNFEITAYWDIPAEFANLVNLEHLYIGNDDPMAYRPEIEFPLLVTTLTKLKHLYIPGYLLKGNLPTEIGNLVNLEVLDLGRNYQLTGSLPASIGKLTKLKQLLLNGNGFSGGIPPELGNLQNLEELDLGDCNFTGSIPASLGNLTKLSRLMLYGNSLGGTIPNLLGIPVTAAVNISYNRFTFAGMETNISRLDSYNNQELLPIGAYIPLSGSSGQNGLFFVEAGGTRASNTYKWYKDNVLIETNTGYEYLYAMELGTYKVVVTNSIATGLTLTSDTYKVTSLPVTLVSFTGKQGFGKNHLTWKTTSETDNSGFEIEKSVDARTFEKIGFVDGNGDTEEDKIYHFTDLQPHRITYYRLKQLDRYDGKFEYSKIIMVKQTGSEISIYPNPAQNQLTISGMQNSEYVSIFSQNGTLVSKELIDTKGNVETGSLVNGIYTIKIGDRTKKIVFRR
jgi:Leucine-rich repeat (LRR) protein